MCENLKISIGWLSAVLNKVDRASSSRHYEVWPLHLLESRSSSHVSITFTSQSHLECNDTYHTNAPPLPTISSCLVSRSFIPCSLISSFDFSGLSFDLPPIVLYHSLSRLTVRFDNTHTIIDLCDSINTFPTQWEMTLNLVLKNGDCRSIYNLRQLIVQLKLKSQKSRFRFALWIWTNTHEHTYTIYIVFMRSTYAI